MGAAATTSCKRHTPADIDSLIAETELLKYSGNNTAGLDKAAQGLALISDKNDPRYWRFRVLHEALSTNCSKGIVPSIGSELPDHLRNTETEVRILWLQSDCGASNTNRVAWLERAAQIANQIDDKASYLRSRYRLAAIYTQQDDIDKALPILDEVIGLARGHDRDLLLSAIGTSAVVYIHRDQYDKAIALSREALAAGAAKNDAMRSRIENNLGWSYLELGEMSLAEENLKKSIGTYASVNNQAQQAETYLNLSLSYSRLRQFDRANQNIAIAKKLLGSSISPADEGEMWALGAEIHYEEGNLAAAREDLAKAKQRVPHPEGPLADHLRLMEGLITGQSGDSRDAETALREVIDSNTARSAWKMQAHSALAGLLVRNKQFNEAAKEYQNALKLIDTRLGKLSQDESKMIFFDAANDMYHGYVEFLLQQGRDLEAFTVADSSRARMLSERTTTPNQEVKLADLQRQLNKANAVALSYWLGPKRNVLWVVSRAGLKQIDLHATEAEIREHVTRYSEAVSKKRDLTEAIKADGQWIRHVLIDPAKDFLSQRVYIVADGELGLLNFETLPGSPGHQWWIEEATVAVAPSLGLLQQSRARSRPTANKILAIGAAKQASEDFPDLEGAAQEIQHIQKQFPTAHVLTGDKATPQGYLAGNPERYEILHFATHGKAARDNPLDSFIVLSGPPNDFKLYARQIQEKPINARLVTVSACRSAGSRSYRGEGPVGLAWAFLSAKADQVVAGLWNVDDRAGALMMDSFYRHLNREHASVPVALREAKLELIRHGSNYQNVPGYWAPFEVFAGVVEP